VKSHINSKKKKKKIYKQRNSQIQTWFFSYTPQKPVTKTSSSTTPEPKTSNLSKADTAKPVMVFSLNNKSSQSSDSISTPSRKGTSGSGFLNLL